MLPFDLGVLADKYGSAIPTNSAQRGFIKASILHSFLLQFFVFGTYFSMGAQTESPCECSPLVEIEPIDQNPEINISEVSAFTSDHCYYVTANLNIDEPTTWDGVRVIMAEGTQIIVKDNFYVLDSYISGCEAMWKGIHVTSSSKIESHDNTTIEDAEFGISLESASSFACTYTRFINNFIGICVGDPFHDPNTAQFINQIGSIRGCEFYTNTTLPNPYPGQYYDPVWPTEPVEVPYNHGYAAIYFAGVGLLDVGLITAEGTDRNKIHDMRNGIVLINSVANIFGTDFYDFEGDIPYKPAKPVLDLNQHGIYSVQSSIVAKNNTFENIQIGCYAAESTTAFERNIFDISTTGAKPSESRGISIYLPLSLNIIRNQFINGYKGVFLYEVHNGYEIAKNQFTRNMKNRGSVGIEVLSQRLSDPADVGEILKNHITIEDGHAEIGINLNIVDDVSVSYDTISFTIDEGQGDFNSGINLIWVSSGYFARNRVIASAPYKGGYNKGVLMSQSSTNRFFCNYLENYSSLMHISAHNLETKLVTTLFHDGNYGLELYKQTMIGTQEHLGNQWLGSYLSGYGAIITPGNEDPVKIAKQNQFISDDSDDPGVLIPEYGPMAVEDIWFLDENGNGQTCLTELDPIAPDPDTLQKLIQNELTFEEYNAEMTWMMKADIFEMMLEFEDLQLNEVLDSFHTAESSNALGELVTFNYQLSHRYGEDRSNRIAYQDTILEMMVDLNYIDSVILTGPISLGSWIALRALKLDTLLDCFDSWTTFIQDEAALSATAYTEILDDITNVTPTNQLEEYYQVTLEAMANNFLRVDFSAGDSTDISELSYLCPWEGGRGHSEALALNTLWADTSLHSVIFDCPEPDPFIGTNPIKTDADNTELQIAPNPANENLEISCNFIPDRIEILDLNMRVLKSQLAGSNHSSVDVSDILPGTYLVRLYSVSNHAVQKIVIVK